MKNLLLLQGESGMYYEETPTYTKADAISLMEQAIQHLQNPEVYPMPALTNNCDAYEVIKYLCFPEGRI